jgi:ABC-type bacteriocin/lantibiotic exporter with double-glycine peptidase domain
MKEKKEGIRMSWIQRKWTSQQADRWTKEDYRTFIISPLIYFLLAIGVALSLLLLWYGWLILAVSVILFLVMVKIIDPKLKAISEDYETKQKKYMEDLEKIARWEE